MNKNHLNWSTEFSIYNHTWKKTATWKKTSLNNLKEKWKELKIMKPN